MLLNRIFYILILVIIAGCGGEQENNASDNNATPTDMGPADAGGSDASEVDTGPQFVCPNDGELVCDGRCENVMISMDHCGACGNACVRGEMTCAGTEGCQCLGDDIMCGARCYDPMITRAHCGECGNECPSSDACIDGDCVEISTSPDVVGVLEATNEGRSMQQDCGVNGIKNAVGPVQLNEQLNIAAQRHAEDMAANQFLEHEGTDGSTVGSRTSAAGYAGSGVGENIARGYDTPQAVVAGWIDSDGHCKNLMEGSFNEMGVGLAINPGTGEKFWAQVFGAR